MTDYEDEIFKAIEYNDVIRFKYYVQFYEKYQFPITLERYNDNLGYHGEGEYQSALDIAIELKVHIDIIKWLIENTNNDINDSCYYFDDDDDYDIVKLIGSLSNSIVYKDYHEKYFQYDKVYLFLLDYENNDQDTIFNEHFTHQSLCELNLLKLVFSYI